MWVGTYAGPEQVEPGIAPLRALQAIWRWGRISSAMITCTASSKTAPAAYGSALTAVVWICCTARTGTYQNYRHDDEDDASLSDNRVMALSAGW